MKEITLSTKIKAYESISELPSEYRSLMESARAALEDAYAPYSNFQVGAALLLDNGEVVRGANQENAAYPMCLCAERVALGSAASRYPGIAVQAMAITVHNSKKAIAKPAAPCGACRQVITETEGRQKRPITLLLQGSEGEIYLVESGEALLPLSFHGGYL